MTLLLCCSLQTPSVQWAAVSSDSPSAVQWCCCFRGTKGLLQSLPSRGCLSCLALGSPPLGKGMVLHGLSASAEISEMCYMKQNGFCYQKTSWPLHMLVL